MQPAGGVRGVAVTQPAARAGLLPSSALPLAYFVFAHLGLAAAFAALCVWPDTPGGYFYHPRMVALVHLLTVPWLTGSILGAFYIVGPLALRLPMPVGRADWVAFAAFASGAPGMVSHFWIGEYHGMAWSAGLVAWGVGWVGIRAARGLPGSSASPAIKLHIALAFINIVAAALLGMVIGLDRWSGFLGWPPAASAFAHAHLAAVGWPVMMVVGLSYRLLPMMLPAAMPSGRAQMWSAVLLEAGLLVLVIALLEQSALAWGGALLIAAGLAAFAQQVRRMLRRRLPRPPALPPRDWSTLQAQAALLWLMAAAVLGLALLAGFPAGADASLGWWYGVAGLVGFLAQMVVGMQGRIIPLHAWYRAMAAAGGRPPARAANALPSARFAFVIFAAWAAGVPLLGIGLAAGHFLTIRAAGALLLAGVIGSAAYMVRTMRVAAEP